MDFELDENVIYGGDPNEYGPLSGGCSSLGQLMIKLIKVGGNKRCIVSRNELFGSN